jgi:uncharacterized protein YndB with AHSA1/START domain
MSQRSVTHATFVIERSYPVTAAAVFAAWATPSAKARWFVGPEGWQQLEREFDFRIGGRERVSGTHKGGIVSTFDASYHDIVPGQRIIYSYAMQLNDKPISVSLATVEFRQAGAGARLVFTEQAAFLDGFDDGGGRERGTGGLLDQLGSELQRGVSASQDPRRQAPQ